jgi:hypothetical protein
VTAKIRSPSGNVFGTQPSHPASRPMRAPKTAFVIWAYGLHFSCREAG